MKSKVFLSFVMCVSVLISLCACGNLSEHEYQSTTESQVQTEVETQSANEDSDKNVTEQNPQSNESKDVIKQNQDDSEKDKEYNYIGNSNTMKFHRPNCISIDQMSESNKVYLNGSRDDAVSRGYKPCKRCKP
ncbi:MAG: hypothetical protein KH216_11820 [Clostridiales bacterium]|nr:hypothetical protein [Clostridiales bacterium]